MIAPEHMDPVRLRLQWSIMQSRRILTDRRRVRLVEMAVMAVAAAAHALLGWASGWQWCAWMSAAAAALMAWNGWAVWDLSRRVKNLGGPGNE